LLLCAVVPKFIYPYVGQNIMHLKLGYRQGRAEAVAKWACASGAGFKGRKIDPWKYFIFLWVCNVLKNNFMTKVLWTSLLVTRKREEKLQKLQMDGLASILGPIFVS